jgi:hypothetical protein
LPASSGTLHTSVVLALQYRDADGKPCGSDRVVVNVQDSQGRVYLPDLGKDGSPVRVVATLELFTVVERKVKASMK